MEIEKDSHEFAGIVVKVLSELGNNYLDMLNCNNDSSIDASRIVAKLKAIDATNWLIEIIRNSKCNRKLQRLNLGGLNSYYWRIPMDNLNYYILLIRRLNSEKICSMQQD